MDELVVETKEQLAAAIMGASQPSFADARANPFKVTWGPTVYTFKEGVHENRARSIARNIRKLLARGKEVPRG